MREDAKYVRRSRPFVHSVLWRNLRLSSFSAILGTACVSGAHDETDRQQQLLSPAEALDAIVKLKATTSPELIADDDAKVSRYRTLSLQLSGGSPDDPATEVDARVKSLPPSAATSAQIAAWKTLQMSSAGRSNVSWNSTAGTPGHVEVGLLLPASTGDEAFNSLEAAAGPLIRSLFATATDDNLVLQTVEDSTKNGTPAGQQPYVQTRRYTRVKKGIPVLDDWYEVTVRPSDWSSRRWVAFISARWSRIDTPPAAATVSAAEVAALVPREDGAPSGCQVDAAPELGLLPLGAFSAEPTYRLAVSGPDGGWRYDISAVTGAVRSKSARAAHYNGSLKITVGRPHEGTAKYPRPVPYAYLYEDDRLYDGKPASCISDGSTAVNHSRGDADRMLADSTSGNLATDYWGNYWNRTGLDASDTTWVIDLRGPYVTDKSPTRNSTPRRIDLAPFTAGTNALLGDDAVHERRRRGEMFYLLNWSHQVYADSLVTQRANIGFQFTADENPVSWDCQNPDSSEDCLNGAAFEGGCLEIYTGSNFGNVAAPVSERHFRKAVLHEHNHLIRNAEGALISTICNTTTESGCWEEGRADFASFAMGKFEFARPAYRPNLQYPANYDGQKYGGGGSIFSGLYADYYLQTSATAALRNVHRFVSSPNDSTRMVGTCGTDVASCPSNSYYRYLLDADLDWSGKFQTRAQISSVFHARVTDANRDTPSVESFPWADETPNTLYAPPFIAKEFNTTATEAASGAAPNSGLLRFDRSDDYDTMTFLGRGGMSYHIRTAHLASGVDTILEILAADGTETVLTQNDDCSPLPGFGTEGLHSCLDFTAPSTGLYRIRLRPYPNSSVGATATYRVWVNLNYDDYGGTQATAGALAPDNNFLTADFSSSTDVDVFKIVSGSSQTLGYLGCSSTGNNVQVDVLDEAGTQIHTFSSASCAPSSPPQVAVNRGVYFLRARSTTGTLGAYSIKATLGDIDAGGDWQLTTAGNAARTLGSELTAGDNDWYTFEGIEGHYVTIETFGLGPGADTVLELYAPSSTLFGRVAPELDALPDTSGGRGFGHWMLTDDDGAFANLGSRLAFFVPVTGTYRVRVKPWNSNTGRYYLLFDQSVTPMTGIAAMP